MTDKTKEALEKVMSYARVAAILPLDAQKQAFDALKAADDDEPTAEDRIDNAVQAMSETHSSWESRCHAIMAAIGKDFGRLQPVADEDTRIVFDQEWTPNYLSVEDSGAARIYCVEPVDENLRMEVRLHGYDEDCNHETFKQFEGKRIRVTVEAIEE
jgi:hypothetical protein